MIADTDIWSVTGCTTDCNCNCVSDTQDVSGGSSVDGNFDGVPDECQGVFVRGDCNRDQAVNITDAVYLLGHLFPQGAGIQLTCEDACDSNDSGNLNLADAILLLGALFPQGAMPPTIPAPHPGPGPDPSMDCLRCW